MNAETLTALAALALKLGTTVEYLWATLLKQAPISGIVDLLTCVALIAGALLATGLVYSKTEGLDPEWRDFMGVEFIAWLAVGAAWLITVGVVSYKLPLALAAFANPTYWALRQLLH